MKMLGVLFGRNNDSTAPAPAPERREDAASLEGALFTAWMRTTPDGAMVYPLDLLQSQNRPAESAPQSGKKESGS